MPELILKIISLLLVGNVVVLTPQFETIHNATITAYSSSVDETDSTPFIMANGQRVFYGAIACPRRYPFGTIVRGLGIDMVCADRMNIRYTGDEFDIWLPSKKEAQEFGKIKADLYILEIN